MVRALVSGHGKMGRAILDALDADPSTEPAGCVDGLAAPGTIALASGRELPLFRDPAAAFDETKPDVVIDFTNAAWTPVLVDAAIPRDVRLVIGTSGLSPDFVADLGRRCEERKLGAVLAANFALGAVLMTHMAKIASRFFDAAEIIELHHDQKVDAPSGTAMETARLMREARGKPFGRNVPDATPIAGSRAAEHGGITIHSIRLPGLVAHQEVLFGGLGQTLAIRHDTTGRDSFMPGILLASREVMRADHLVIGLDALIGLV